MENDFKKVARDRYAWTDDITSLFTDLRALGASLQNAVKQRREYIGQDLQARASQIGAALEKEIRNSTALLIELGQLAEERKQRAKERKQTRAEKERQILDIESRLLLRELLPEIEQHIKQCQWVQDATTYSRHFKEILRSLTDASKAASDLLLNRNFKQRFKEECENLQAPSVKLLFPGKQGQVARRKFVAEDYRLSEILSEGEQKVVALADFLAEAGLKNPPAPIVFDDPVNSLDYKRLKYVVARLVKLSQERQVIVFTHNIWFATELLSCFEKQAEHCAYYDIRSEGDQRGIVSKGTHPRADTFKSVKGKINGLIHDAGQSSGETQLALVEKAYEYLRNICEIIVEAELLQGVTQRYQPNVMMTKLQGIKFSKLQEAVNTIYPIYEKSCRYIVSHSQPLETLNVRPGLDELKGDWGKVLSARDRYLG
jgi:hypothetical protein